MAAQGNRLDRARSHEAPTRSLSDASVPDANSDAQVRASEKEATNGETKAAEELKSGREAGQNDNTAEKRRRSSVIVRRGTGPRTAMGKERSKLNSLKHGILSRAVVLDGESPAEFYSLHRGLRDCHRPVGTHEDLLVEELASIWWRKRRFLIAEGAVIRLGSHFFEYDEKQRQLVEAGEIAQLSSCGGLARKITNPEILMRCLGLLASLRDAIEQNGFNPENDEAVLTTLYGDLEEDHWEDTLFNSYLVWSKVASLPDHIREEGKFLSPELCKKEVLKGLSNEIKRLVRYKKEQNAIESERMRLTSLCLNVPDSLLRYLAYLDRALDRTLNQLERAQRMRLGQPVTPRVDVNVSSS